MKKNSILILICLLTILSLSNCKSEETPDPCANTNFTITGLVSISTGVGAADGSITITAPIGNYVYKIGNGNYTSVRSFNNLVAGTYTISVKDSQECVLTKQFIVP